VKTAELAATAPREMRAAQLAVLAVFFLNVFGLAG
jgi:hypothetical protein